MNTQVNWSEQYSTLPKWMQTTLNGIAWLLSIPNFVWSIPGLSKLKGIRMILLTVVAVLYNVFGSFDYNIIADTICKVAAMFGKECDQQWWVNAFTMFYAWLTAALAIEDKKK